MTAADPRIGAFFADPGPWQAEASRLRALVLAHPLTEGFKWRSPCYSLAGPNGGNVATIWRMKDYCALAFFKGALLDDPAQALVAPGENSRAMRTLRFTDTTQIAAMESAINGFLRAAIAVEGTGQKIDFPKDDVPVPDELTGRLADDPDLAAAFDALTPGRRRGWLLHFSAPRQSATRLSRIEKATPRILAGKGLHDR
jgi:uncharacterized protein YdeI (YjbR/CyaY-like superfamily)